MSKGKKSLLFFTAAIVLLGSIAGVYARNTETSPADFGRGVALAVDALTIANIVDILLISAIVIVVIVAVIGIGKGIKEFEHKIIAATIVAMIGIILFMGSIFLGRTSYYVWENTYGLKDPFLDIVTNTTFLGTCLLLGLGLTFSMFTLLMYYVIKKSKRLSKSPVKQ